MDLSSTAEGLLGLVWVLASSPASKYLVQLSSRFPSDIHVVSDGNRENWESARDIFVLLCSGLASLLLQTLFRKAVLTIPVKGQKLRQLFAFRRTVGSGVCEKSQIRYFLFFFLFALELGLLHMAPLTSDELFLVDGGVGKQRT